MSPGGQRVILGLALSSSLLIVGGAVGGLLAGLLQRGGSGWDQIANILGGVLLGAAAGVSVGVVLAMRLTIRPLRDVAAVSGVIATLLLLVGTYRARQEVNRAAAETTSDGLRFPEPTEPAVVPGPPP